MLREHTLRIPSPERALPGRATRVAVAAKHFVLGTPMEPPFPAAMETALFGMGCFWGAERKFWQAPGVYTTAVGYAGGSTPNPTYREVCSGMTGHTEAVRVVFDPARTSFANLLRPRRIIMSIIALRCGRYMQLTFCVSASSTATPTSSVVKCAEKSKAPLPAASARSRCSRPTISMVLL